MQHCVLPTFLIMSLLARRYATLVEIVMARVNVVSKIISAYSYDRDTEILDVWLKNGRHVKHRVSEGVFENLRTAEPPDFYYANYVASDSETRSRPSAWRLVFVALVALVFSLSIALPAGGGAMRVVAASSK